MKIRILSAALLMVLICIVFFLSGCSRRSVNGEAVVDLAGQWKIIINDSYDNASISFDDSGSQDIIIPGNWLEILKKNDNLASTVWIRKKIFIGKEHAVRGPLLCVERIGVADETYFNGVKIGSSGIFPPSPEDLHYQIAWNTPRRYFIPENLIRYGSNNVIAIRIYSHIQSGVMGEIAIRDYYRDYFSHVISGYQPLLINVSAVVLNLMLILVYMMLYLSERKKKEYLYFTLIILGTLLCTFLTFPLPVMIDGLLRYKLGIMLYTLTNFFVFLGVKEFLAYKQRRLVFIALVFLAVVEMAALFAPATKIFVFYSAILSLIFVNLAIIATAWIFILAVKRDPRRYWYFLVMVIPIAISVLRNSYYIFSYRFNELPLTIFMHVPVVFMFIALYYIYDFEKSRKEKEVLYSALLRKSKNDNRLLKSMQDKNKKPEPRDVISNVIEYLDGNYAEKYDRIELSKKFGLNEDYMGQVFKKATGTNISNYINTNRINAARELLTDTSAKIIDIAYHVGFDNLTHFHRQFKTHTGCTPNEYRAVNKKQQD